jgi:hypothetical protein
MLAAEVERRTGERPTPSKLSFRRIKRAHGDARRCGFVPREVRKADVVAAAPADRM